MIFIVVVVIVVVLLPDRWRSPHCSQQSSWTAALSLWVATAAAAAPRLSRCSNSRGSTKILTLTARCVRHVGTPCALSGEKLAWGMGSYSPSNASAGRSLPRPRTNESRHCYCRGDFRADQTEAAGPRRVETRVGDPFNPAVGMPVNVERSTSRDPAGSPASHTHCKFINHQHGSALVYQTP